MLILKGALTRSVDLGANIVFVEVVLCATFVAYTLLGGELTVRRLFTFLSLLHLCRRSVNTFFVRGLFMINEVTVALGRIQVN